MELGRGGRGGEQEAEQEQEEEEEKEEKEDAAANSNNTGSGDETAGEGESSVHTRDREDHSGSEASERGPSPTTTLAAARAAAALNAAAAAATTFADGGPSEPKQHALHSRVLPPTQPARELRPPTATTVHHGALPTLGKSLSNSSSVSALHGAAAAMSARTAGLHANGSSDTTPSGSAHTSSPGSRTHSARPSVDANVLSPLPGQELGEGSDAATRARVLGGALNSLPRSGGSRNGHDGSNERNREGASPGAARRVVNGGSAPGVRAPPAAPSSGAAGRRGPRTSHIAKLQHALQSQSAAVGRKPRANFGEGSGDGGEGSAPAGTLAAQHAALAAAAADLAASLPPLSPVKGRAAPAPSAQSTTDNAACHATTTRTTGSHLGLAQRLAALAAVPLAKRALPALTALNAKGKRAHSLSFAQLYAQALHVATALRGHRHLRPPHRETATQSGDCAGLMFDTSQPESALHFAVALHACLAAGVAAVPIACPAAEDVELEAKTGSLLSACRVNTVITDKATLKRLQGSRQHPGAKLRHWPQLAWLRVDALGRDGGSSSSSDKSTAAAEQQGLPHVSDPAAPALVLAHHDADNNVRPVIVTHGALERHCAALAAEAASASSDADSGMTVAAATGGAASGAADAGQVLPGTGAALPSGPTPLLLATPLQSGAGLYQGLLAAIHSGIPVLIASCGDGPLLLTGKRDQAGVAAALAAPLLAALRAGPVSASTPLDVLLAADVARALSDPGVVRQTASVGLTRVRRLLVAATGPLPATMLRSLEALRAHGLHPRAIGLVVNTARGGTLALTPPGGAALPVLARADLLRRGILEYAATGSSAAGGAGVVELLPVGEPLPGEALAVARLGVAELCRQRELGEIVVTAAAAASAYRGLDRPSRQDFGLQLAGASGAAFVRTGLVGCIDARPVGGGLPRVYVVGTVEGLLVVDGCWINSAAVAETLQRAAHARRPQAKVHRDAVTLFTVQVAGRARLVALVEGVGAAAAVDEPVLLPDHDSSQTDLLTAASTTTTAAAPPLDAAEAWMGAMQRAVAREHGVAPFFLALLEPGTLPRLRHGGAADAPAASSQFERGLLPLAAILMNGQQCTPDLPRATSSSSAEAARRGMAPLAAMAAADNRLSEAVGPRLTLSEDVCAARSVVSLLVKRQARAATVPVITTIDRRGREDVLTAEALLRRARRCAGLLHKHEVGEGTPVMLLLPPTASLTVAFYACLLLGAVPVTLATPRSRAEVRQWLPVAQGVLAASHARCVLTDDRTWRKVRAVDKAWATQPGLRALHIDHPGHKEHGAVYSPAHRSEVAYVEYSVSSRGVLAGVAVTHQMMLTLGQATVSQVDLAAHETLVVCTEASTGLGLALHTYIPLFAPECRVVLVDAAATTHPFLWLRVVSERHASAALVSYLPVFNSVMAAAAAATSRSGDHAPNLQGLAGGVANHNQGHHHHRGRHHRQRQPASLDVSELDLSAVRQCMVVSRERPWLPVAEAFIQAFQLAGLRPDVMGMLLETRANALVAVGAAARLQPLYVDVRSLREQRLQLLARGSQHEVALQPLGTLAPGVRVAIVDPESEKHSAGNAVGEIWVSSVYNATSFSGLAADVLARVNEEHLDRHLPGHEASFARTGLAGFLHEGQLYAVGSMEDFLLVSGFT